LSCPSSISQAAAAHALASAQTFVGESVKALPGAPRLCLRALNAVPHLRCLVPDGAFYLYPSCSVRSQGQPEGKTIATISTSSLSPRQGWGRIGPWSGLWAFSYFRLSTATSMEMIKEACDPSRSLLRSALRLPERSGDSGLVLLPSFA